MTYYSSIFFLPLSVLVLMLYLVLHFPLRGVSCYSLSSNLTCPVSYHFLTVPRRGHSEEKVRLEVRILHLLTYHAILSLPCSFSVGANLYGLG